MAEMKSARKPTPEETRKFLDIYRVVMKGSRFQVLLLLALLYSSGKCQAHLPLPDSGAHWYLIDFDEYHVPQQYRQYQILGDTIFGADTARLISHSANDFTAFREDAQGRVFSLRGDTNSGPVETLVCDFSLSAGDTFLYVSTQTDTCIVDSVGIYFAAAGGRKTWYLHNIHPFTGNVFRWIEGMGPGSDLLNPQYHFVFSGTTETGCFTDASGYAFDAGWCQLLSDSPETETDFFRIYPVPASGVIYFMTDAQTGEWKITDLCGKVFLSGNTLPERILLNDLPSGVYIFTFMTGKNTIVRKFLNE